MPTFFLRDVVKNKILYAPRRRRHRMITPIERCPSLGLKPSSWIHRSPGVIIVVTPLVHKYIAINVFHSSKLCLKDV
jgi:hypothetical protein